MTQPPPELLELLERVRVEVEALISAGDSGTVTIGYGNQGLRLVVQKHVRAVQIVRRTEPEIRLLDKRQRR